MSSILDQIIAPVKIMLIGENGSGKTGSLASLVCAGYKLRIIDTDKGVKILKSLLLDPHYPYAKIIKEKNIDLSQAERYRDMWIRNHNQDVTLKIVECNDIGRPMRK